MKEPFLVAIDSFVFNDISRDYFHEDKNKHKKANDFLNKFYMSGSIPIITWHHIEELLAHHDDEVVFKSIELLNQLPLVSVINLEIEYFLGSILSIEREEISNILSSKESNIGAVIEETSKKIYKLCSGKELIEPLLSVIDVLRERVLSKVNSSKEMSSISRAKALKPHYEYKLSDIKNMKNYTYSQEATRAILDDMKYKLIKEIGQQGDKKIFSAEAVATEFISSIKIDSNIVDKPMIDLICKNSGLSKKEFEKIKSWEDLECIPIFQSRLETISNMLPSLDRDSILSIPEDDCPTWLLWKELYKIRTKAERASGSDINDALLAGLCLYSDLTIVDKRTHEYLTQIKRKNTILKDYMGRFEKLSGYTELLTYLPNNSIK
ncbi:MAG: hypothetical protein KAI79_07235 [Bacteroidales bacterium]|nr:hypothetical protein [Bacteroidales bacterium]